LHIMNQHLSPIDWLLDSDPSIRWQVLGDLLHAPEDHDAVKSAWVAEENAHVAAERARVATEGWGGHLLHLQGADGTWGGAAWNRGWDSTMHVLMLLRDFGLDPESGAARQALARVREQVTWQGDPSYAGNPFFTGEVEPCINGQAGAAGAYFGQDISTIIARLLSEQLPDGGWNCDAPGSARSSFNTTICVLEALLAWEERHGNAVTRRRGEEERRGEGETRGHGDEEGRGDTVTRRRGEKKIMETVAAVREARRRGEEYLLERRLFHRKSTGAVIERDRKGGAAWTSFAFPTWWHYDVLRGLEYLRRAGVQNDVRVAEAVELVASKRTADGRWLLDTQYPGTLPVDLGESVGQPSRWITLRALRVLDWFAG
jgi:hypothetical protein